MLSFADFLRSKGQVPEVSIPFYLRWAAMYRNHMASLPAHFSQQDGIENFLRYLTRRYNDRQVQQARHAVQLSIYYSRSLKNRDDSRTHSPENAKSAIAPPASGNFSFDSAQTLQQEASRLMHLKHLSFRTEKTYLAWIAQFLAFNASTKPSALTEEHLKHFLSYLAVERKVSAATQKQAFNALLYLYRNVLLKEIVGLEAVIPSRKPRRLPVVLTREELRQVFGHLSGTNRLIAGVIYGAGLRLEECLGMRVKDVDFARNCLAIRSGKGGKDRETVLPDKAAEELKQHLAKVRRLYERDRRRSLAGVCIPEALDRKYTGASKEWS